MRPHPWSRVAAGRSHPRHICDEDLALLIAIPQAEFGSIVGWSNLRGIVDELASHRFVFPAFPAVVSEGTFPSGLYCVQS
ncbi:hypothetical protein ABIF73_009505 [Bradyrhizobium japonicum]|jgi:hypothetical protein